MTDLATVDPRAQAQQAHNDREHLLAGAEHAASSTAATSPADARARATAIAKRLETGADGLLPEVGLPLLKVAADIWLALGRMADVGPSMVINSAHTMTVDEARVAARTIAEGFAAQAGRLA